MFGRGPVCNIAPEDLLQEEVQRIAIDLVAELSVHLINSTLQVGIELFIREVEFLLLSLFQTDDVVVNLGDIGLGLPDQVLLLVQSEREVRNQLILIFLL